jgi:regulator of sigma E protease
MDFIISAVAFIVVFSAIILIHEFGHFYVARKAGIKVEEFGIGLPPRIWGKKIKGTIYSVNWIPFGGFVRLYGEDSFDPKVLKDKRSFAGKPLLARMAVVVAGVFMNFVLAIVLLSIGFTVGIEPLIVNSDDLFKSIETNILEIDQEARIKSVTEGSSAHGAGLLPEDVVIRVDGEVFFDISQFEEKKSTVSILRGGEMYEFTLIQQEEGDNYGINLYDIIYLPRVAVGEVATDSKIYASGLRLGDTIISANEKPIYYLSEFNEVIEGESAINFNVVRDHQTLIIPYAEPVQEFLEDSRHTVISDVIDDGPAFKAGFQADDHILTIEGKEIVELEDAVEITKANPGKDLAYQIERNGEGIEIKVAPDKNGLIGVHLVSVITYKNDQFSLYNSEYVTSVIELHDVSYPFPESVYHAATETGRLSVLTIGMVGNVVRSIVSQFDVPEGVAGPVGIARLTHLFVQDGLLALLRFTALLSLSLAVINIIPFPALDGGRLLFLLVEAVRRKRIPAKWEASIHALGFVILIGLIFIITYSDILNIFS